MYENALTSIGLGKKESEVYEVLLRIGPSQISKILENTTFKRGDLYNILDQLQAWNLVEIEQKGKQKLYKPAHPSVLEKAIDEQEKEILQTKKTLQSTLPDLLSLYRAISDKPGVQYFEGSEGIERVLSDSLTAKEEIRSYLDVEMVQTRIKDINARYVKKRDALGIKKRIIVLDSPFARNYFSGFLQQITDVKFLDGSTTHFENAMQIYDNKISYLKIDATLQQANGIIIHDPSIYVMHKNLFDNLWDRLPAFSNKKKSEISSASDEGPLVALN